MYSIINYSLHSEPSYFNELNINEICFWDIKPFTSVLILISLILLSMFVIMKVYPKKKPC